MRTFGDVEQRWTRLTTSIGVDLRSAIREGIKPNPCEDGLRSVCWRGFLVYGPLSKASWTKKLNESRTGYTSLRDHYLKYINNPNDLQSTSDPLADDDKSPWSTLRQDETSREEIFQDVTRCMQDNYFFREPTTQRKLLDILFIYSKLNPDTGYRQGMHELLAPILWVLEQDVINIRTVSQPAKSKEGAEFMLSVLDRQYIEHDAFNLFCAVMQTCKSFYEMGENQDSSAIVAQSNRIHDELLATIDPDLAHHLQVVGVLPQIYSIRWIRLLFGREFEFNDTLKMWDILFAENLTVDIVDMTCVAMLLRVRWQLIEADYTTAITLLTRFKLPPSKEGPRSLIKDAVYLCRNKTADAGAGVVEYYSGQRPKVVEGEDGQGYSPSAIHHKQNKRLSQARASPSRSPARFQSPQRQLENLFMDVSGQLSKRTEGWSVAKAVRGAVGEVKRNVSNFQGTHSRESSADNSNQINEEKRALSDRLENLETRNKALAAVLETVLQTLRTCKPGSSSTSTDTVTTSEDAFNMALTKLQFVSVYLKDSEIPIPYEQDVNEPKSEDKPQPEDKSKSDAPPNGMELGPVLTQVTSAKSSQSTEDQKDDSSEAPTSKPASRASSRGHQVRPSLVNSSFSFMLGENRHRSSFVSSASPLPEQRRDSDAQDRPEKLGKETKGKQDPKQSKQAEMKDDGFTMSPWKG